MDDKELKRRIEEILNSIRDDIIAFAQDMVRTKSMTCEEKDVAALVERKMRALGFDEVSMDSIGNVMGRMGDGEKTLLFDSHMDTVSVIDADQWTHDPFGAEIVDGKLYGRGSVDMKCPLVASIYGAYIAKQLGLTEGHRILVSASTMEEDYDGEAVRLLLEERKLCPDAVVICEPTDLKIATGHRGRALIEVNVKGKGCHASNPGVGVNPVYLMRDVIDRVTKLSHRLDYHVGEDKGSVALTNIYCNTASNNSVPQDATIILDRRLANGEDEQAISSEMNDMLKELKATWTFSDIPGKSWTGKPFLFHSFLPAWKISEEHELVKKAKAAYATIEGEEATLFQMGASTNGVTTAGLLKIPTIVFGPGDIRLAHGRDEYCEIGSMLKACGMYAALCVNW